MANQLRKMKRTRNHQWRVIFAYKLTDDQARVLAYGPEVNEESVQLTTQMVAENSAVSCWKCELTFQQAAGTPCRGKAKMNGGV